MAFRIAQSLSQCEDGAENEVMKKCLDEMTARVGGDAGAIGIDSKGRIAIAKNSRRLAWAYATFDPENRDQELFEVHSGCDTDDHFIDYLRLTES